MTTKNVAVIVCSLNNGGAERIAGLLSKELSKYYNTYVFLLDTQNIVYEYGGTIVAVGCAGEFYEYDISINKKKYHIDCAISFLEKMNFANIRTKGAECVLVSERSVQSLAQPPHTAETLQIQRYYDHADAIIACSEGVKYDLVHHYNVQGKITTIYNFIDKEKIRLKAREGLPDEVQEFLQGMAFFVNVGRLHPQKNQKRLLLQFSYFHASHRNMKLLILGTGELHDELASYIAELGLQDSVRMIPYTANPFVYIARARALILSSHYEGLPNAVLEAMTLGCPVIAADCLAGPRELLMDETDYAKPLPGLKVCKRGILVCDDETEDSGNTRYMAEAMEMLYASDSLAQDFIRRQHDYMEQYTNRRILDQWLRLIDECERKERVNVVDLEEKTLRTARHIVIFGAGFVGKGVFLCLKERYQIDCFVVTGKGGNDKVCLGLPVREIAELDYSPGDTAVIIGVGYASQDDVINTLSEYGYHQIVFPYIESLENMDEESGRKEL